MDLSRHLPLSNRPRDDESGVTRDERAAVAGLIERAAELLTGRPDAGPRAEGFVRDVGLDGRDCSDLGSLADAVRGGGRLRVRRLTTTVRALLVLADDVGADAAIPPDVLGRVSLYASTKASFDRRAVLAGHTVRASDAGWEFGRGPVLESTALGIARFVLGLTDVAPRAVPRQPPEVSAPMSPDATI
jgi:hypothetical protein